MIYKGEYVTVTFIVVQKLFGVRNENNTAVVFINSDEDGKSRVTGNIII